MNKKQLGFMVFLLAALAACAWLWRSSPRNIPSVPTSGTPTENGVPIALAEPTTNPSGSTDRDRIPVVVNETAVGALPPATSAGSALIRVLVLDKVNDRPISGARVMATHDSDVQHGLLEEIEGTRGKTFESISTGTDGRVEIEMPIGIAAQVYARGRVEEFGSDEVAVSALNIGEVREIVLRLPSGDDMPFWMKIVDEDTRGAIPWASVTFDVHGKSSVSETTDARGLVFQQLRSWAGASIRVEAERRAICFVAPSLGHDTVETALVVSLPLAATLRVAVVDATGTPVRDASVAVSTAGYNLSSSSNSGFSFMFDDKHWSAITDAAGVATLTSLPVRIPLSGSTKTPKVWNSGEPLILEPGETRNVTWTISGGTALRGIVLDQHDKPVVDRAIWLRPAERKTPTLFNFHSSDVTRSAKTNAEGRFAFEDVSPGQWAVGPSALDGTKNHAADDVPPLALFVEVHDGSENLDVTIRVDRGLYIRGRLIGSDGKAPKHGTVHAWNPTTGLFVFKQVESADGSFELGPTMAGRYEVTGDANPDAPSDPIEVDAGATGVELRLKAGAVLAGRVVGLDGAPCEADITVSAKNSESAHVHMIGTHNGKFELTGLAADIFDVSANTTDGRTGVLTGIALAAGASREDLTITVEPAGRVRVRHMGPNPYVNVVILQNEIMYDTDGIEREVSREFVAPVGRVTVRATYYDDDRRQVERVVEVKVGETVDVTFEKGAR